MNKRLFFLRAALVAAVFLFVACKTKGNGGDETGRGNFSPVVRHDQSSQHDGSTGHQADQFKTVGENPQDGTQDSTMDGTSAGRTSGTGVGTGVPENRRSEVMEAGEPVPELANIYFEFDKAELTESAITQLEKNAAYLKSKPELMVVLRGHTDELGTEEYNISLGERRAQTVREYLVTVQEIDAARLETVSFGKSMPLETGTDEAAHAKNRRVEFFVFLK